MGPLKFFLGIDIARSKEGIYLIQRKYAFELVADVGVSGAKPFNTPMEQHKKLISYGLNSLLHTDCPNALNDPLIKEPDQFRSLVGCLIYLTITRSDICYVVQHLSQFMHAPKTSHMEAAIRVVRYIKDSPGLGFFLPSQNSLQLSGYCDSDWASCPMSRRFITGYYVKLGDSLLSWRTRNKIQCPVLLQKQSTEIWLRPHVNLFGS